MPRPSRPPIGLSLARTAKAVSRAFDAALTEAGGSLPVWLILMSLKQKACASQRELAAAVGVQGATLTHHLDAMAADGLITRDRDPHKRRMQVVRLTATGEEMFHHLAGAATAHDTRLRSGLSATDIQQLENLLHRLQNNVTHASLDGNRR
jgi:MarR family transcriptional regulator for hemolysin